MGTVVFKLKIDVYLYDVYPIGYPMAPPVKTGKSTLRFCFLFIIRMCSVNALYIMDTQKFTNNLFRELCVGANFDFKRFRKDAEKLKVTCA